MPYVEFTFRLRALALRQLMLREAIVMATSDDPQVALHRTLLEGDAGL